MMDAEIKQMRCARCGKLFTSEHRFAEVIRCCVEEHDDHYISELMLQVSVPVESVQITVPEKDDEYLVIH